MLRSKLNKKDIKPIWGKSENISERCKGRLTQKERLFCTEKTQHKYINFQEEKTTMPKLQMMDTL